ncbi:MAG: hypothetical protein R3C19_16985 [Planctomycetaceae bacterium]
MAPVREGHPHVFWKIAADVNLSPQVADAGMGAVYLVDHEWVAYEQLHMKGSDIRRVPRADVVAEFEEVVSLLEEAANRGDETPATTAYARLRNDADRRLDLPALLGEIDSERARALTGEGVQRMAYRIVAEQQFWQRWRRARWYWASIVFEWLLLTGLALFAVWPAVCGGSPIRWASHITLLPVFFLLPVYLGYATYSFTSVGPSGGILYPYLLTFCRGGSVTQIDRWLLDRIPQVLEPISTPVGSPMVLSGFGMPGPSYALLTGAAAGAIMLATMSVYCRWRRRS